jgi:hypothetical protein
MIAGKHRRWSLVGATLLGLLVALCLALVACGEEGVTPNCPPLPLYNIHDENWLSEPGVAEARADAVDAGCLTELGDAQRSD